MSATAILMIIVGIWVLINTVNGNIPGLIGGTTKFNLPTTSSSTSSTTSTSNAAK